jgi:hypothetical protein
MKKAVFWDVTQCGSSNNRRFGGTYRVHQHIPRRENLKSYILSLCYFVLVDYYIA